MRAWRQWLNQWYNRGMQFVHHEGERVCPDAPDLIFEGHLENYRFMAQFIVGMEVLDVGCGNGYGAQWLLDAGAVGVHGIDRSRSALRYARRRYGDARLVFQRMNAERLQFPPTRFDVVTSLENLEHLRHPERCIAETRRVLRANGLFLLATPNKEISAPGEGRCPNRYHRTEFDFDGLDGLLRRHYRETAIFETGFPGCEVGRRLKDARRGRGRIGIEAFDQARVQVGPYTVDLSHRHNSHSFLAMAWGTR